MLAAVVAVMARVAVTVFAVTVFAFVMVRLLPGDVFTNLWAENGFTEEQLAEERSRVGLDQPLYEQYARWMGSLLSGDLGVSLRTHSSVTDDLRQRVPVTLELTFFSFAIATAVGSTAGLIAGFLRGSWVDHTIRMVAMLAIAIPNFVFATVALLILSLYFNWIPSQRYATLFDDPKSNLLQFFLPSLILGAWGAALITRMTRATVLDITPSDFVRTAYAKGLRSRTVALRHVLKPALPPIVASMGIMFTQLVSGAVVIEIIFGLPGLGHYTVQAIHTRDYAVVQGVTVLLAVVVVGVNAATDFIVLAVDPRSRG